MGVTEDLDCFDVLERWMVRPNSESAGAIGLTRESEEEAE